MVSEVRGWGLEVRRSQRSEASISAVASRPQTNWNSSIPSLSNHKFEMDTNYWLWLSCLIITLAAILLPFLVFIKKKTRNTSLPPLNNSSLSTSPPVGWDYEVFLSFRGEDTRKTFTDYLYTDLVDSGIRTFRDNNELRIGEKIGDELLKAIRQSKISIPVFSKDYASSKWCLLELTTMVECKRTSGQIIKPIFYDVEPSDVRKQMGSYKKAFREHKKHFDSATVEGWKEALREVGELKGWEVKNVADGHQGELVKRVVSEVWGELKRNSLVVNDCLVGIDDHVEEMMKLLSVHSSDVRIVGIHGMGGIGKTTIAKAIYNQLSQHFESCCFLPDVRETAQQHNGLVHLQNQLISNILKRRCVDISTMDEGINVIKVRFSGKKVLVVIDDADQRIHLHALVGKCDWFGSGSRIIVTTRNKDILNLPEVDCRTYEPEELDYNQSLRLFSRHAFRRDNPPEDYDILSRDVVSTTGGLPLALEIIGSFLSGKRKAVWNETLKKLTRIPDGQVQKKLRISFEALEYEQQQIFLDIACFLIGADRRFAFHMWDDCKFYPEIGIEVLILTSLVKIGDDNELRMHDQLRDLGRDIVRQENFKEPQERSRVWFHEEAYEILESHSACCFTNEEFGGLSNLRFLQMDYANQLDGDFKGLLSKLRWLHWNGCPEIFKPTNFHLKNLVILDLSWSKVTEAWEGWNHIKIARKLKVLNLTGCIYMVRTPDFSAYASLERLILEGCVSLVHIDPSIEYLKSLVFLNVQNCRELNRLPLEFDSVEALMRLLIDGTSIQEVPIGRGVMNKLETLSATRCKSLSQIFTPAGHLKSLSDLKLDESGITELPDSICSLVKLQRLSLRRCKLQELPISIGKLESLIELRLSGTNITELPDSIGNLKHLRILEINESSIVKLPSAIGMLLKLEELDASSCYDLEGEFPSNIERLSSLRILKLSWTDICSLPTSICGLSHLQTLDLECCLQLQFLPELPCSLVSLKVTCMSMETFLNIPSLINLKELRLSDCYKLLKIPEDIGKLVKLENLTLEGISISILPMELGGLSRLKELIFIKCEQLQYLPTLPSSLVILCLERCRSMKSFPDLSNLKNLSELVLNHLSELTEIQGLGRLELLIKLNVYECKQLCTLEGLEQLRSLRYLTTSQCESLEALPDLSNLKKLRKLDASHCKNLNEIRGLDRLESLEDLDMSWCISLEKLPDLSNLEMLEILKLAGCQKLHDIEGLEALKSLQMLDLSSCTALKRIPELSRLTNIKELRLCNFEKLSEIWGIEELKFLSLLDLSSCTALERSPDLSRLTNLRKLQLCNCEKLSEIRGLEKLKFLGNLNISGCKSLGKLPDIPNFCRVER
ncbi:disease resistance protein L6-like isoform X2 [Cornus florida]|uniref:disease resistance protein L6-like isoform X2 n=1 Tax=Cornus florida TaxID=4283 RepID=UPI0028A0A3C7|nr:disease resistance protein L6-like isoform X2 [Cornus florida]